MNALKHLILICIVSLTSSIFGSELPIVWQTTDFDFSKAKTGDTINLVFKAKLQNGFYMYATDFACDLGPVPVEIEFEGKGLEKIGTPKAINTHKKQDLDWDCLINIFDNEVELHQQVVLKNTETSVKYKINYLTCKKDDSCIPGKKTGTIVLGAAKNNVGITQALAPEVACQSIEEQSNLTGHKKSFFWYLVAAFFAGLITVFMPCIFPLMPMTVSYFSKGNSSKIQTIQKTVVYGLSIIVIYTSLAILPSLFLGSDRVNNWISTHWIPNALFFIVFVVFGLSFLGAFEIRLPNKWANKADNLADKGGYLGLFFMALTLIIVSFSCTGPFISSILILSSKGGVGIKPLLGMLSYSLGFALPFVVLSLTPKLFSKLPKSGSWMNVAKVIFGILELALALKFLSSIDLVYGLGILERRTFLIIWSILGLLLSMYLLGVIKFTHDADEPVKLSVPRFLLAILTFFATIYFALGVFDRPVNALSGIVPPIIKPHTGKELCEKPKYANHLHSPNGYNGYFDLEQASKCAKEKGKLVLIDFTGHGCTNCRKMEDNILSESSVKAKIHDTYIIASLYVDDKSVLDKTEYVKDQDGQLITTLGEKNLLFEKENFCEVSQPLYVIYDPNTGKTIKKTAYTSDLNTFINFLK